MNSDHTDFLVAPAITAEAQEIFYRLMQGDLIELKRSYKRLLIDLYCFELVDDLFVEQEFEKFNLASY